MKYFILFYLLIFSRVSFGNHNANENDRLADEIYNAYVNHYIFKYSATILSLLFLYFIYKNAKNWMSITTGKHNVIGEVTYSELGWNAGWRDGKEAAVYYKYYINNKLHTGGISRRFYFSPKRRKYFFEKYPRGTKEVIYYSNEAPDFSWFAKAPNKTTVMFYAFYGNFMWWFMANGLVGFIVWVLSHAPQK